MKEVYITCLIVRDLRGLLGSACGRLGEVLGAIWTPFEALGDVGRRLGELLGTNWTRFRALGEILGRSCEQSECIRAIFVAPHGKAREKMITHDDPR